MAGTNDGRIICLITGANQGLGFETAKALLHATGPDPYGDPENRKPYHVLLGCRDLEKGQAAAGELLSATTTEAAGSGVAVGAVTPIKLDVTSAADASAAAEFVREKFGRLDVLVNNAGIITQGLDTRDRLRKDWETNVWGVVNVTEAFLPLLLVSSSSSSCEEKKNPMTTTTTTTEEQVTEGEGKEADERGREARLIFVGSSMGSLTGASDPSSRYYRSVTGASPSEYRVSKASLNMLMVEYWKRHGLHEGGNLRVVTADPGPNATGFMGGGEEMRKKALEMGVQGPERGAMVIVGCVREDRDGGEGRMWGAYGESPW